MMDRRLFLVTSLAGALAAPLAGGAQQAGRVYRVGLLGGSRQNIDALKEGLADLGHREGQGFVFEQRDLEGRFERLPAAIDSLVKVPVDVIVVGGSEFVQAVEKVTQKIPIVFTNVGDPVEQGSSPATPSPDATSPGSRT
jgi:putative tryptophan/tyrosine transport system substrate-binding protein